jgi:glycosyltransferase involved in cell wall biosynthesis
MLSILIPTYNYSVYPLVCELQKQCVECRIDFEILVQDDGSKDEVLIKENSKINLLENCQFEKNAVNLGRAKTRNILGEKGKFENLLFLDSDTIPIHSTFILNYIKEIQNPFQIIYGGIKYQVTKPEKHILLRWVYGNKREALSLEKRKKHPYKSFLSLNFLIKKIVFKTARFNELIPNLRHEDTLFSFELKTKCIDIKHIENPVLHLGLDSNLEFLQKSEEAIDGLNYLVLKGLLPHQYTKLGLWFFTLKKYKLDYLFFILIGKCIPMFKKNILGNNPSLFIFDLYRLYYYCKIYS